MIKRKNFLYLPIGLFILILTTLMVGCGKNEHSREELSMEELLGETTDSVEQAVSENEPPLSDGTFTSLLNQKLYTNYTISSHQETTLFDRFSYTSAEKSVFTDMEDSLAQTTFFIYNFNDTTATKNAFTNWLTCFGSKCEEVLLKEDKERVEENALWCGVYDTSIVVLKFSPEAFEHKNELKQVVFQIMNKTLKYTLNVTLDNQLKWG